MSALDSSTPCWNDRIEGFCFKLIEALAPYFRRSSLVSRERRDESWKARHPNLKEPFRPKPLQLLPLERIGWWPTSDRLKFVQPLMNSL